jgi:uncharacterized protein
VEDIMNKRMLLTTAFLAGVLASALAGAGEVDYDLWQAAKLHRGGDTAAAVAIWQRWAGRGDVDAAYNLAVVHQHGDGVAKDNDKALKWYRVAAERNDTSSQHQLGLMYLRGDGVAADEREAHRWLTLKRSHHAHHANTPQMKAWRTQAVALIQERDMREAILASRGNGDDATKVLAELRRRAGIANTPTLAAAPQPSREN